MTASSPMAVARIAAGLTQADLAEKVGLSQGQLSRIEHGTNDPAVSVALAIAAELGVAVTTLWKRASPQPAPQHRAQKAIASDREHSRPRNKLGRTRE